MILVILDDQNTKERSYQNEINRTFDQKTKKIKNGMNPTQDSKHNFRTSDGNSGIG